MTSNSAFKKKVRAYAAEHGVPYMEARRILVEQGDGPSESALGPKPQPDAFRLVTIQQEMDETMRLPYPFHITEHGYVDNQHFWDGDPWFLIGFEDRSPEARAAAEAEPYGSPDGRNIALTRIEWLKNPQAAVGLHPVFADDKRKWYTFTGAVETVTERWAAYAQAPETVMATVSSGDGGAVEATFAVGHVLSLLPRSLVRRMRENFWSASEKDDEVLTVLSSLVDEDSGTSAEIERFWEYCESTEDQDGEPVGYSLVLDREQAEAWYDAYENTRFVFLPDATPDPAGAEGGRP